MQYIFQVCSINIIMNENFNDHDSIEKNRSISWCSGIVTAAAGTKIDLPHMNESRTTERREETIRRKRKGERGDRCRLRMCVRVTLSFFVFLFILFSSFSYFFFSLHLYPLEPEQPRIFIHKTSQLSPHHNSLPYLNTQVWISAAWATLTKWRFITCKYV